MELHTIGIDLAKTVFHLVGLNLRDEVVVRKRFSRTQLLRFTANAHVELIGMGACGGAHFLGRALREQGHEVRLMPAQYVKPYVKTKKSNYTDAEAIAVAVARATMRFVPIRTDDQLDMQSLCWYPKKGPPTGSEIRSLWNCCLVACPLREYRCYWDIRASG